MRRIPGSPSNPDLSRLAATQIAACLEGVDVGSALPIDSASDLCDTLEYVIPAILSDAHREWEGESHDGFYISSAVKSGDAGAALAGTCILISDQTVTPFALDVNLADAGTFRTFRVRLGEPGSGRLGISGPPVHSSAAREMLWALNDRLERVAWAYDVTV